MTTNRILLNNIKKPTVSLRNPGYYAFIVNNYNTIVGLFKNIFPASKAILRII
jgi:hypothetical protein